MGSKTWFRAIIPLFITRRPGEANNPWKQSAKFNMSPNRALIRYDQVRCPLPSQSYITRIPATISQHKHLAITDFVSKIHQKWLQPSWPRFEKSTMFRGAGYMWQALNLLHVKHDTEGLFFSFFLNVKQMWLHPSLPLMLSVQWGLVLVQQSITGHAFISITTDLLFNHNTVFTICLDRLLASFRLNLTAYGNRTVPALSGRWCW